ncbi:baseplate J/gp47 family protein [Pseudovibrio sp. Tun.PSC04-5.I4]|uniref:baseplate J/gp47 family protein n=1 Tax=Pseudovibrio sp. Tun.PSC04-5.I4 TaxID=1798213 RepID=UPI000888929A|nr:baseplate J/gp47 family protein [Pseudovibrio sp. Tun.PSC04-5.I4]SDQ99783.1 Phage-related baseplate assembly protein [Pseudovibrio sp. Tun.PSC04-5.I4]
MSRFNPHSFPRPVVVQPLDYEQLRQDRIEEAVAGFHAKDIAYTVENLETDPVVIAAEAAAYGDLHFIGRLNDAARVVLLSEFAEGSDLDLKVKRSGLQRLAGEDDIALRERERIEQKGKSSGGPMEYYVARAMGVDPRLRHVKGFGETRNITERWLIFSVLTHDNNGIADQELLDRISSSLRQTGFKRNFVQIEVVSAVVTTVNVSAVLHYYPEAIIPEHPEAALLQAYIKDQQQGFDITTSYLDHYLHSNGVQRVELPGWTDRIAASNEAFALGDVQITTERLIS